MKTRARTTSIEAFRSLRDLGARQRQVLELLNIRAMSNLEISKTLSLPINAVTPRTKELRDLGLVEEKGRKVCPYTHRLVIVWGRILPPTMSANLELFGDHHAV